VQTISPTTSLLFNPKQATAHSQFYQASSIYNGVKPVGFLRLARCLQIIYDKESSQYGAMTMLDPSTNPSGSRAPQEHIGCKNGLGPASKEKRLTLHLQLTVGVACCRLSVVCSCLSVVCSCPRTRWVFSKLTSCLLKKRFIVQLHMIYNKYQI
jgi:hypothetical protein